MSHALLLALLLAAPTAAQDDPGQPAIIVTGQRIQDLRDALARCLARNCPTDQDADATLALAEALFLNGGYREGRDTVQASLRRNRGNAGAFPEPVSDLYRAHGRLSRHLGFDEDGRRSTYGILRALREGIPQEDHRHFTARFEISEVLMMAGNYRSARRQLEELVRHARAAGREDVATTAELRMLWYDDIYFPRGDARARLIQVSRLTAPDQRMRATGARILLARIYRREGRTVQADALIAEIGQAARSGTTRRLLYAPSYQLHMVDHGSTPEAESMEGGPMGPSMLANRILSIPDNFEDKWIDVGFWVMPDGTVSDLEILRKRNNPDWADPLLASMRQRRYAPGPEATYRMERYTYTASYTRTTRTRLPVRSLGARVEYFDLTRDMPGQAPSAPPTPEGPGN